MKNGNEIEIPITQDKFDKLQNEAVEFTPDEYLEMQGWQAAGMMLSNIALHYRALLINTAFITPDETTFCETQRDNAENLMRQATALHEVAIKRIYARRAG